MKRQIFLVIAIAFAALASFAQVCTEASLLQTPGQWKAGMKGSEGGTAADLAREKQIVAALHAMIKSKYAPMSLEADFYGVYGGSQPNVPVNGYSYNILPLNYFCEGNVQKTAHESSTSFQVAANLFEAEIFDAAQGDRLLAEGFNVMADMPVEKDGYYYFKETDASLGFGQTGKSSGWLITYPGKLPYAYVTQKEFLEKRKINLAAQMADAAAGFKDALKTLEIQKTYIEKEYQGDPEKLKKHMATDYLAVKAKYEKLLAENEKTFAPAFAKIETLLKAPAAELDRPAIVKKDPKDYLSYLFTEDDDAFGKVLIKPNPGYFRPNLPPSSPQFFWVSLRGNPKEKIAARFMADITAAVDFGVLKAMLGK
jgi:hypothetical protein